MVHIKRVDNPDELAQILLLQQENLPENISWETKRKEGFVTVKHDLELLTEMNTACPHFIAVSYNEVVGYCLCMHPKFGNEIEILRPMFEQIRKYYPNDDYMVMGQVCISRDYRGQGIFRKLYDHMLLGIQPEFSTIITEVDLKNTTSVNAHYAIGFKLICEYESDDRRWVLIKLEADK
ncbi:GNAT family N-acetyltransferase [Aureitalea sp. L0-47]|uniref:GNAT family N-acetyltransferase n=1 Tax=Aureitalea sp. L0-47 TaxID=2816962 RepID=UPI0022377E74|nr:GNAT family N-acetyltransferase [Aureitalea sp. L0-47]MCW5518378.1 GNAT family N-acetyltransferase [Aureitalea sp. L0-47]